MNRTQQVIALTLIGIVAIVGGILTIRRNQKQSDGDQGSKLILLQDVKKDHQLLFTRERNREDGMQMTEIWTYNQGQEQLLVSDRDHQSLRAQEIRSGDNRIVFVGFGPDGSPSDLLLFNPETSEFKKIASGKISSGLWDEEGQSVYYIEDQVDYSDYTSQFDASLFTLRRYSIPSGVDESLGTFDELSGVKKTSSIRFVFIGASIGLVSSGDDSTFEDHLWRVSDRQLESVVAFHEYPSYHKTSYLGSSSDGSTLYILYGMNDAGTDDRVAKFTVAAKSFTELVRLGFAGDARLSPDGEALASLAHGTVDPETVRLSVQSTAASSAQVITEGSTSDEMRFLIWLGDSSGFLFDQDLKQYWYDQASGKTREVRFPDGVTRLDIIGWI